MNEILYLRRVTHLLEKSDDLSQFAEVDEASECLSLVVSIEGRLLYSDCHVHINGLGCHKNLNLLIE